MNKIYPFIFLAGAIFVYFYFEKQSTQQKNFNEIVERIERQNDSLLKSIELDKEQIIKYNAKVDSLEKVKNKVIVKYKEKENEIDKGSSAYLVSEFESIFASSGIE